MNISRSSLSTCWTQFPTVFLSARRKIATKNHVDSSQTSKCTNSLAANSVTNLKMKAILTTLKKKRMRKVLPCWDESSSECLLTVPRSTKRKTCRTTTEKRNRTWWISYKNIKMNAKMEIILHFADNLKWNSRIVTMSQEPKNSSKSASSTLSTTNKSAT